MNKSFFDLLYRAFLSCSFVLLITCAAFAKCDDPPGPGVDWHGCNKTGAYLKDKDLSKANLSGANLSLANLVDESVWEGTAAGKPFGIEGNGRPLKFRLLHVLEFSETGLIQRENVWIDLAAIIQQLT